MLIPVLVLVTGLTIVPSVFAHVTVKPNQVGVVSYQTFMVSVPNEKDDPTVGLRLVIPEGLTSVTPTVKPGWMISTKTAGEGEEAKVTEISWTGGSIPAGQRDDFTFSAKTPSDPTELHWKAYQTYQTGIVVPWDMDPNAPKPSVAPGEDEGGVTPYSVTKVVNDLAPASSGMQPATSGKSESSNSSMVFSVVALALSCAALGLTLRKK